MQHSIRNGANKILKEENASVLHYQSLPQWIKFRIGFGYRCPSTQRRRFWLLLGGIKYAMNKGAVRTFGCRCIIHVICWCALIGGSNLRDIVITFRIKWPAIQRVDSKILLPEVMKLIRTHGYEVGNIDSTICLHSQKSILILRSHEKRA